MQTINKDGIELIKSFESFKPKAYLLSGEKYYTIGYGHSFDNKVNANTAWSQSYAEEVLIKDLARFERSVRLLADKYNFTFNDNQFSALVSYTFNRGQGGLDQLLRNSKNENEVGVNIVIYWGSTVLYKTGLIRRRKAEQALYFKSGLTQVSNSNGKLAVDGIWGKSTTLALQKSLGTYRDGIISGQIKNEITKSIHGVEYGKNGSEMMKKLQNKIGVSSDGYIGENTIKALQRYLKTPVDGVLSKPSTMVKELQKRLNDRTF